MKTVEEFGRTVAEARAKALKALGVPEGIEEGVEVEVLDEGSPGNATGWGRKFARVKVTLSKEDAVPVKAEKPARAEKPAPAPAAKKAEPEVEDEDDDDLDDEDLDDEDLDEDAPADILEDILDLMHLQASVEEDEIDSQLYLNIVGPDLGILIGKHGQTLEALQFILNLIVNHNQEERVRVIVDVGGYRERRERTLKELAQRMARRALDEGCNVTLEPMMANERRLIHLALADDPRVETFSQGEEPMRKVIIAPRKDGGRR
ncbi:MAG: KH domain-containing protein [Armatimonadetes bacterium]|nr:KH domain-containing protein [Armatimonadota bacterium]